MDIPKQSRADRYESFYREFDSPLMQKIRRETFGEDIGLHSWGSAQEMRADVARLNVSSSSRIVDLGCGPCGPLTFILATVGCRGTGIELSPSALRAGQARARSLGVESLLSVQEGDLNESLPFAARSYLFQVKSRNLSNTAADKPEVPQPGCLWRPCIAHKRCRISLGASGQRLAHSPLQ